MPWTFERCEWIWIGTDYDQMPQDMFGTNWKSDVKWIAFLYTKLMSQLDDIGLVSNRIEWKPPKHINGT